MDLDGRHATVIGRCDAILFFVGAGLLSLFGLFPISMVDGENDDHRRDAGKFTP